MRTRDSGDCTVNTMNDDSCLSASTLGSSSVTTQVGLIDPLSRKLCVVRKQQDMKKRVIWGIEVPEELHWKGWELGKETTRTLILKNLSLKTQKLKYRYQNEGPGRDLAPEPSNSQIDGLLYDTDCRTVFLIYQYNPGVNWQNLQ
ncbi:cilia- and flagella-associated protein 65-like [Rattus rattus]|uniref:cilia- and flagella-associated protein 65-like n=1 Tax=Rattus rattus TaxID=10117 RepID=UPI0013F2DD21|nr:cilia- and flagella-associated protein 65-like [Rattus rattus]